MNGPIGQLIKPIEPICLPNYTINYMKEGTKCYVTGWGSNWAKFNETNFESNYFFKIETKIKSKIYFY
jgi:hypothetical protein